MAESAGVAGASAVAGGLGFIVTWICDGWPGAGGASGTRTDVVVGSR